MEVATFIQDINHFDAKILDPNTLLNGFINLVAANDASGFEFQQATTFLEDKKN